MRWLTQTIEAVHMAVAAVRANKTRGVLTVLGIIIGIVGVITTMTAANGLSNSFKESVSALGSDVLYVSRTPWIMRGNWFEYRNRPNITLKVAERLEQTLDGALAVNPTIHTSRPVKYKSEVREDIDIIGTNDQLVLVSSLVPELGRFLTRSEVAFKKPVCVIGASVREGLFNGYDPLNKVIRIGRYSYRVVGVMEKHGGAGFFGGPDLDKRIYVPITTFIKNFGGRERDFDIAVKGPSAMRAALEDFELELIGEMRMIRKLTPTEKDDFSINRMDALVGAFNNVMGTLVLIGMVITGLSLFVGGVGVMNIMFVSVTERTREIGVRKALGARRRVVLAQFLFESSMICLVGGLIGLAAAFATTELIDHMLMPASISLPIIVIALGVAVAVGVLSGVIPAYRASRLDPIVALRYE